MDVIKLPSFVVFDDYDGEGLIFSLRKSTWQKLNQYETSMLIELLQRSAQAEAGDFSPSEADLIERLRSDSLIEFGPQTNLSAKPSPHCEQQMESLKNSSLRVTFGQRLVGAAHILCVLAELRKENEGVYLAYQYINSIKRKVLPGEVAFQLAREEYWWYRLVTGLVEHRVAYLCGSGKEGLCLVRAFALSAYLRSLGVLARVVIGRPKYGCPRGFDLHAWAEIDGKAINEVPNVRDGYRVIYDELP